MFFSFCRPGWEYMKNVSPAHNTHAGTDYGWPSERTVVSQAVSSSPSLLSARVPASVAYPIGEHPCGTTLLLRC